MEIKGIAKGEDSSLTLHYIGEGESLDYLKNLCFSSVSHERVISCNIWEIKEKIHNMPGSIVLVETNRLLKSLLPDHGWNTFSRVRQIINLNGDFYNQKKVILKGS